MNRSLEDGVKRIILIVFVIVENRLSSVITGWCVNDASIVRVRADS